MLANQASSTPPTTAAFSVQIMLDGTGRLWTSLGQSPGLQMAWRRLPVFRSDRERRFALVSLIVAGPDAPFSRSLGTCKYRNGLHRLGREFGSRSTTSSFSFFHRAFHRPSRILCGTFSGTVQRE